MTFSLTGAKVLVFGGTGSLGGCFVQRLLALNPKIVKVFSRDEQKQLEMRRTFHNHRELEFIIGDVRDRLRVQEAIHDMDVVINAAALKHIPVCEEAPTEAVLTNVIGVINIRQEALAAGIHTVVSISTDKAVKPVNVLGMTKAIHERIMLAPVPVGCLTRFLCVRYGNVLGSRGSVVPLFLKCIADAKPLPITHPAMTRFILTLDEAVDCILAALGRGESGEVWVKRCPAVRIVDLGQAIAAGLGEDRPYPTTHVGIRPGEKVHEILISSEESSNTSIDDGYFRVKTGYVNSDESVGHSEYSSFSEQKLSEDQILNLLKSGGWLSSL
jgi:UDP-glucose 4-epimerase